MNIVATQYNLEMRTLEIYVSGCYNNCPGCQNPMLQSFDIGTPYEDWLLSINEKLIDFDSLIDNIWLLGGEPLDQSMIDMQKLLEYLYTFDKDIWLFTGHTYQEADNRITDRTRTCISYLKYGFYDENDLTDDNICFGVKLASGNQNIIQVK